MKAVRSRVRVQSQQRWGENVIAPHAPLRLQLKAMSAQVVPVIPNELDNFIHLWNREILLSVSALLITTMN